MPPGVWGPLEDFVFKHGGIAALCGLVVAYLPQFVGLVDWGAWGPAVTVVTGTIVSAARLYAADNTAVPPPTGPAGSDPPAVLPFRS